MIKPRLGVGFEGVLHAEGSTGAGSLSYVEPPTAGAMVWLVQAIEHYRVAIYPKRPVIGQGQRIRVWLRAQLLGYFIALDVPDAEQCTLDMIRQIDFHDFRPDVDLAIEAGVIRFEGPGTFPSIAELLGRAT